MARDSFDFKAFQKYTDNFKKINSNLQNFLDDFMLKQAQIAIGKIKRKTPVDTGTLRMNWFYEKGQEKFTIIIYNPMEYGSFVEYGHTTRGGTGWVEGYFMMTLSITEVERAMPKRFENAFKKFLQEGGL